MKPNWFWKMIIILAVTFPLAYALSTMFTSADGGTDGFPLATPAHAPAQTPADFPGVGSYYIGQDARCNQYGKCVAEGVRNSCAPSKEERRKETTLVFNALACGGYDSMHDQLQVYPDGTCMFVSGCPSNCPGR